jgi:hypothetical protein
VINITTGNHTVEMGFSDILSELGASLGIQSVFFYNQYLQINIQIIYFQKKKGLIPMVAILEHVAIAKAFGNFNNFVIA